MVETLAIFTLKANGTSAPFPPTDLTPALSYSEQAKIGTYTFTAGRMGSTSIQATLMYPLCLDKIWTGAEYVEFRGEKYWIFTTPTSSKSNDDIRYKHELNFTSERIALDNTYFFDVVSPDATDVDQFVSNSTKFTFFGDIAEFVKRMNYSLKYSGLGYTVVLDDGVSSEGKLISFEDKFFSDVLVEVFNTYELPFYFVGKVIHIGFTDNAITHEFRYGHDKELLSISKTNANYRVINRCTGVGSSDNIPYYYPNDTQKGSVLAIAGAENKGVLQDNITITNPFIFQDKVSLNKKIEYIDTEKTLSPTVWLYKEDWDGVGRPPVFMPMNWYNYNGTITYKSRFLDNSINENGSYISFTKTNITNNNGQLWNVHFNLYFKFNFEESSTIGFENIDGDLEFSIYHSNNTIETTFKTGMPWIAFLYKEEEFPNNGQEIAHKNNPNYEYTEWVNLPSGNIIIKISYSFGFFIQNYMLNGGLLRDKRTCTASFSLRKRSAPVFRKYKTWFYDERRISLPDIGLSIGDAIPQVGDYITQQQKDGSLMITSDKLLPPIYRETNGAERFYNAINNTYLSPDTGEYYQFENEYSGNNPKEEIVSFDYIKPSIKNIKNAAGEFIGEIVEVAFDDQDNDEFNDKENKWEHPYFYIKLRTFDGDYGFNLFEQGIANGEMTISMTTGKCAACNFKIGVAEDENIPNKFYNTIQVDANGNIVPGDFDKKVNNKNIIASQQDTSLREVWIAVEKDTETFGTIMPSNQRKYKPEPGDAFVLINIDLPKSYILAAENELKEAIIKYMAVNNSEKFNFSINFKRIFFAQYPEIMAQLNENARLIIEYDGSKYTLYVSNYTYKVSNDEILPEITVELSDTLTVKKGTLQKSIDAVKADIMTSIGSIDFLKMGLKYFIRKDTDDSANGHLVFKNGLYVTRGADEDAVVLQEENNSIQEENNAIQEYTATPASDKPVTPTEMSLGDLTNVKTLVDEPAVEDMVLAKLAGTSEWTQIKKPVGGGGGGGTDSKYTSTIANKETKTIPSLKELEGKKLSELEGKSFSNLFDMILFPTLYPTFVAPSTTISSTAVTNGQAVKIGTASAQFSTLNHVFNPGSIIISYPDGTKDTSQGARSGAETTAVYTYDGSSTVPDYYNVWGEHRYTVTVNYAAGKQPKDSKGNDYGSPLPAGSVSASLIVNVGNNWFAGVGTNYAIQGIATQLTKTLEFNFAAEITGRYIWKIPKQKTAAKMEYYDTNSSQWIDDGLSTNWLITDSNPYWRITNNNQTMRGALKLRLTLTNA